MEISYDGVLTMPNNYAVIEKDEMTYVEGGVSLNVNIAMLSKVYCSTIASQYTNATGLSKSRIAKEIYAHALMYYASSSKITLWAILLGGASYTTTYVALSWIKNHSNPIDLGGDSALRVGIFEAVWAVL